MVKAVLPVIVLLGAWVPSTANAQVIEGRVSDAVNGDAVGLSAVIVLDAERSPVEMTAADVDGRYTVTVPGPGEYYLVVERLGYFENESPLLAIEGEGPFRADFEMRPEPFRLDPLEVTVRNEELEDYLTLEFGLHPATLKGYRSIQGIRLAEAQLKADDNTDLLRELYIPVTHGQQVCIGTFGAGAALPERMGYERTRAATEAQGGAVDAGASCGALYVDGIRCRNEHIENIDRSRIGVVIVLPGVVRLYTRDFDWTFRPGGRTGACG